MGRKKKEIEASGEGEYPKTMFHKQLATVVVNSPEELDALDPDYQDTPFEAE